VDAKKLTCCRVLVGQEGDSPPRAAVRRAWKLLEKQMALVPAGSVPMISADPLDDFEQRDSRRKVRLHLEEVDSFFIDRMAVSNAEYLGFVRSGAYADLELWPKVVWPHLVQFVDRSGAPGPRYWKDGRPDRELADHPVTGVCWYEAHAFARWCGKTLPDSARWQRACSWHAAGEGHYTTKMYPWGDLFDPRRANVWDSGVGQTVPVDSYFDGCTPNGVYQLIGNVWEWVDGDFADSPPIDQTTAALAEVRGGAFDTYFSRQATCQFRTGQPRLYRGNNTGFRCCVPTSRLIHKP
jgi:iron(II)-dependent oxidoreductase